MKILISILLISSVGLLTNNFSNIESYNNISKCNCSGLFGSCAITCNQTNSSCNCILTANCACDNKVYQILPTQTAAQYQNSEAAQKYFQSLNTKTGNTIAIYLETLRIAIENDDLETYSEQATLLEEAFKELTETEQNAYLVWVLNNLKK